MKIFCRRRHDGRNVILFALRTKRFVSGGHAVGPVAPPSGRNSLKF